MQSHQLGTCTRNQPGCVTCALMMIGTASAMRVIMLLVTLTRIRAVHVPRGKQLDGVIQAIDAEDAAVIQYRMAGSTHVPMSRGPSFVEQHVAMLSNFLRTMCIPYCWVRGDASLRLRARGALYTWTFCCRTARRSSGTAGRSGEDGGRQALIRAWLQRKQEQRQIQRRIDSWRGNLEVTILRHVALPAAFRPRCLPPQRTRDEAS